MPLLWVFSWELHEEFHHSFLRVSNDGLLLLLFLLPIVIITGGFSLFSRRGQRILRHVLSRGWLSHFIYILWRRVVNRDLIRFFLLVFDLCHLRCE
jgi:hypothetical protein